MRLMFITRCRMLITICFTFLKMMHTTESFESTENKKGFKKQFEKFWPNAWRTFCYQLILTVGFVFCVYFYLPTQCVIIQQMFVFASSCFCQLSNIAFNTYSTLNSFQPLECSIIYLIYYFASSCFCQLRSIVFKLASVLLAQLHRIRIGQCFAILQPFSKLDNS